jgi:hypothetical protein
MRIQGIDEKGLILEEKLAIVRDEFPKTAPDDLQPAFFSKRVNGNPRDVIIRNGRIIIYDN